MVFWRYRVDGEIISLKSDIFLLKGKEGDDGYF